MNDQTDKPPLVLDHFLPDTLDEFRLLPSSLLFDEGYMTPRPAQIKRFKQLTGWSQRHIANIAGVHNDHKGSSTVRKWMAPLGNKDHRSISYAAWRLLLVSSGVVKNV